MIFITYRFNSWFGIVNREKFSPEAGKFLPSKTRIVQLAFAKAVP